MSVVYFRRFRMEFDLRARLPAPVLPRGYRWLAWNPRQIERHARVKHASFRASLDARVFSCLGDIAGCHQLMGEIATQAAFLDRATWLLHYEGGTWSPPADCGTIQGLRHRNRLGAVQNVGVTPEHRGLGLGRALLLQSLHGFQAARLKRVYLEVTADNDPAVRLYRSLGFKLVRTMYKAVEEAPLAAV